MSEPTFKLKDKVKFVKEFSAQSLPGISLRVALEGTITGLWFTNGYDTSGYTYRVLVEIAGIHETVAELDLISMQQFKPGAQGELCQLNWD